MTGDEMNHLLSEEEIRTAFAKANTSSHARPWLAEHEAIQKALIDKLVDQGWKSPEEVDALMDSMWRKGMKEGKEGRTWTSTT